MTDRLGGNGDGPTPPLDADECDQLIDRFGERLRRLQHEATEIRQEFDRLHSRYLGRIERREIP